MGMVAILVMWPEPFKQLSFPHPMAAPYEIWLIGQAVSEEKMFLKIVDDDGWTTESAYTISSLMSLEAQVN